MVSPGRVLVMHCEHDDLVLPAEARANASWASRSELLLFPRGDHNSIHAHNLRAILAVRVARASPERRQRGRRQAGPSIDPPRLAPASI